MKKLFIAAMLLAGSFAMHAQDSDNLDYQLKPDEKMGYIITQKGDKVEGVVKLVGTDQNPWMNQKKVKFIAKTDIDPEKKSQKFKVMDASDIQEYVAIGDDGMERKFKEIKYTNKREAITNSNGGLGGQIKQIKNFSSTTHLAEIIVEGTISVYRLYGYPSPVAVGASDVAEEQRNEENLRAFPSFVFQKEDSKLKELDVADIKKLVEDCKLVADKLAAGSYPSYDPAKEEKKKSGFGKLVKNEVDRAGTKLAVMSKEIFTDYNANCGKK